MTDNPHYITMEDYLKILDETLAGTFEDPSHPEDISIAVELANKHIEAVLSYQTRKWWIDNGPKPRTGLGNSADKSKYYTEDSGFR